MIRWIRELLWAGRRSKVTEILTEAYMIRIETASTYSDGENELRRFKTWEELQR